MRSENPQHRAIFKYFDREPLDDANMPYMKALALTVSEKKFFKVFFFWLPWQLEFFMEFKSLKNSESASPKNHFCAVSLKSDCGFREDFSVIVYVHTDRRWTLTNHNSSSEHLCSGELKISYASCALDLSSMRFICKRSLNSHN